MNHRGIVAAVLLSGAPFIWSCAQPKAGTDGTGGDGGSVSATGGSTATGTGGSTATGGSTGTGARSAQGGSTGTGGLTATGGSPATGGSTATGGSPATTGGGTGNGGSTTGTAGGGPTGSGGSTGTGGRGSTTGTGGRGSTGSGGTAGSTNGAAGHGPTGSGGSAPGTGGATGGAPGTGGSGSGGATVAGTIVPLYTDPTDSSWNAIITAAEAHPTVHVVAIVNPSDGPGSSRSSGYTSGIAALQAAHIEVIGYIATGYGSHSIASMEAEIDQWKSFYPTLQGIFFDEQSNATGDVAHYQTLSQYAKSVGLSYTVGNPGTDVPAAYIGALDTMLIYESNGVPSISSLAAWSSYAPSNFGVIPYAVSAMDSTFVKQARQYVEYIYLTNDDLPNPWDSLTSYFSTLLGALE